MDLSFLTKISVSIYILIVVGLGFFCCNALVMNLYLNKWFSTLDTFRFIVYSFGFGMVILLLLYFCIVMLFYKQIRRLMDKDDQKETANFFFALFLITTVFATLKNGQMLLIYLEKDTISLTQKDFVQSYKSYFKLVIVISLSIAFVDGFSGDIINWVSKRWTNWKKKRSQSLESPSDLPNDTPPQPPSHTPA